jgi:hypothetical protein
MNRTRHTRRHRHKVQDRVLSLVPAVVPSPPGSTPRRRGSRNGRPVSGPRPLTPHASTASADQAAKGARIGRQDAAQVSATGSRQCGHALPEGSRRHLKRCQDVRCIRSTGLPKAGRWSGSCPDWLCKYGYHHTIVTQSGRLDDETRLAKGKFPLDSLRWSSPSVNRLRSGFVRAFCMIGQQIQPCRKWQPGGCPSIVAPLIRKFFGIEPIFAG